MANKIASTVYEVRASQHPYFASLPDSASFSQLTGSNNQNLGEKHAQDS